MKSTLALLSGSALLAGLLAGCGQTGPLYMPNPPSRPAPTPAQTEQPPQPVPSNNASTPAPHR
ncbi:LPS translocon maturation chaperone LptM [Massilia sp.]|uniref:LPS translocon maturation chaperone LptM n=1 Tax=Massilia sp. TaxID=1882437 RepID=UPI0028A0A520|nr:lipoprotein [Massilia sp.]